MYTNMRFKSLGLGRREKDASSQTDIRQVSSHLCCSSSVCHKAIQYYSKAIFAEKKYNIIQIFVYMATFTITSKKWSSRPLLYQLI